ncbi:hypothetical protein GGR57DRAFT_508205 [Xylariaceae sp. FL1272]|nr:hypothetical protein GGR57DRAFT_508205 [Xylariaceae sp. FL1272]
MPPYKVYFLRRQGRSSVLARSRSCRQPQSHSHDHHPAHAADMKPTGFRDLGNKAEEFYDWKFDTLKNMADAFVAQLD